MIKTLLIANRGEIAVRIMRTASALGVKTVAVYSDADALAPHVKAADEAVRLGPAPVSESYLRQDLILAAAKASGAEAIHPGYGFLSENADFARAVAAEGLIFLGPSAQAIEIMGDKARAKRAMLAAGVPCVPGYQGDDQSDDRLMKEARALGFPLMVKAAAGGGGRGMRFVDQENELERAIALARSEAENAFGNGDLILERAVLRPRHVEVQVFADAHGSTLHFGERDCSVQRRHQKVIEEAPCPVMTPELRARMGKAAVEAAKAVDYRGAGTVEFLLDEHSEFYFLEMNTRLQVEHPVTEEITGLDLVELQLRVASDEPLRMAQEQVLLEGHSIEVRLYAEDPLQDFLPSTGRVLLFDVPLTEGIRVDSGIETGGEVSPFYDPMIAKVIATGKDRAEALQRLRNALAGTAVFGPKTNRDFLLDGLSQPTFENGSATTAFIAETYGAKGFRQGDLSSTEVASGAVLLYLHNQDLARSEALDVNDELLGWSSDGNLRSVFDFGDMGLVRVEALGKSAFQVGEQEVVLRDKTETSARFFVNGKAHTTRYLLETASILHLANNRRTYRLEHQASRAAGSSAEAGGRVCAPMHGKLLSIDVAKGQSVEVGQRLAVLEAMKMQHEILAPSAGVIVSLAAKPESQIAADDLILEIETKPTEGQI